MPTVTCPIDGTEFHIPKSHLERLRRPPTCSPECKKASMRGKGHWHWKKGEYVDAHGYVRVWTESGEHKLKHRVVMEKKLGRPLEEYEIVRHKDGNRKNNALRNLVLYVEKPAQARMAKAQLRRRARRAA